MVLYYCLQIYYDRIKPKDRFDVSWIKAKNREEAWDIIEAEVANNNSQEILLTKRELNVLIKKLENWK